MHGSKDSVLFQVVKTVYYGRLQSSTLWQVVGTANYSSYQRQHIVAGSQDSIIWKVANTV